jgi:hypothetical protein
LGHAVLFRDSGSHPILFSISSTTAVRKLLKRVVTPEFPQDKIEKIHSKTDADKNLSRHIHEFTYGINSEPLALLALTRASLIHDVDQRGVFNMQLAAVEEPHMAEMYRHKSIAEQSSLDLAWDSLRQDQFGELRACLFSNHQELVRFRKLLVNIILATDIFDKELNTWRRNRWEEAFSTDDFDSDLRETIALEHIIQASDVSHTMQHW